MSSLIKGDNMKNGNAKPKKLKHMVTGVYIFFVIYGFLAFYYYIKENDYLTYLFLIGFTILFIFLLILTEEIKKTKNIEV